MVRIVSPACLLLLGLTLTASLPATAQNSAGAVVESANGSVNVSVNQGRLVRLDRPAANVFIANPKIADVQVKSNRLFYVFGIGEGETSLYAVDAQDRVIFSSNVRVANNIEQIREMLRAAQPESQVEVQTLNGVVILTGTVAKPSEIEEIGQLVQRFVGEKQQVVNRLKTATPMQVNLQVKIAEVSRDVVKEVGFNIATRDPTGGFLFNLSRGRDFVSIGNTDISSLPLAPMPGPNGSTLQVPYNPSTGQFVNPLAAGTSYLFNRPSDTRTTLGMAGKLLGLDAAGAIDALAQDGLVTILAEPNLTALSGETASFLAGGEFAIPAPDDNGQIVIQYKQYGVGLSFTPVVLSGERISLKVKPEVSELSSAGAITVNGISVPGLITRRADTTVELGSGQSLMIAGLLRNGSNQIVNKLPGVGDLPILGALFKSDRFQRQETELVIVVTPYLVRPVSAKDIKLPTDGFTAPTDLERWFLGSTARVKKPPTAAPPQPAAPAAPAAKPGFGF